MRTGLRFLKRCTNSFKLVKPHRNFLFSTGKSEEADLSGRVESSLKSVEADPISEKAVPTKSTFETILSSLDLPYSFTGNKLEIKEYTGYMGERIFAQHKIPKNIVVEHLYKIYQGSLYSMAALDEEFLNEYLEPGFAKRVITSLNNLKQAGYEIVAIEDQQGRRGEPVPLMRRIIDMTMIKGLSVNRDENRSEAEYHKYVDIDDIGLVIYTPTEVTDPKSFINPEKNKTIYDGTRKMVFRLLLEIQSPLRLMVKTPDKSEIYLDNQVYTWKHLAVFESQMKEPEKFTSFSKLETFMEWLGKYKFGMWKIVDIDNYMVGNPLIKDSAVREGFKDEIFKGSKYDTESTIDIKKV